MEIIIIDFTWGLVTGFIAGGFMGAVVMGLLAYGKDKSQHSAT